MRTRTLYTLALFGLAASAGPLACDTSSAHGRGAAHEAPRAAELRSAVVRTAIDAATRALRTRGYAPTGEERRGFLLERASLVEEVPMRSGTCYVAIGAASSALTSLELAVHDSDGARVAEEDGHVGARAALRFCPPSSGTYYLAARSIAGNGIVALRVFDGPSGLDVRVDDLFGPLEPTGPAP